MSQGGSVIFSADVLALKHTLPNRNKFETYTPQIMELVPLISVILEYGN